MDSRRYIRRNRRRKKSGNNRNLVIYLLLLTVILIIAVVFVKQLGTLLVKDDQKNNALVINDQYVWPELDVELLSISPYSRPGTVLEYINNVVIHYVANPGSSAIGNRDYFENLSKAKSTAASSHFIVGLEGEIIQCIPLSEIAYCSNNRNNDTIGVEVCHPDETGQFSDITYEKLVELCAWLCLRYGLNENDLIRHYDVSGKNCPKYYVENEAAWEQLKRDVGLKMKVYPEK